jgi:hypothetical protein
MIVDAIHGVHNIKFAVIEKLPKLALCVDFLGKLFLSVGCARIGWQE